MATPLEQLEAQLTRTGEELMKQEAILQRSRAIAQPHIDRLALREARVSELEKKFSQLEAGVTAMRAIGSDSDSDNAEDVDG